MRRHQPRAPGVPAVLFLAGMAGGCEILDPTVCTMEARPAIRVEVLDSISGAPVRGAVRVVAVDGTTRFELDSQDIFLPPSADPDTVAFGPFYLAHERPGTYDVTVEAPGYVLWRQMAVRVRDGECHVQTAEQTALLQR